MKKLAFILAVVALTIAPCPASPLPTPTTVQAAQAPAPDSSERYVGWVVGHSDSGYGAIFRSSDGGATWTRQGSPAEIPDTMLQSAAAVDPLTCWVVGESAGGYGTILRTEDGGSTWTRQGSPADIPDCGLAKICALDRDTAWVVGTPGAILFTEDGGRNWAQKQTADIPPVLLQGVFALDRDNVWVTGDVHEGYGTIFRTADGGKTWERKGSSADVPHSALLDVHAADEDTAWIACQGGATPPTTSLLKTEDNGATWKGQVLGSGFFDTNSVTTIGEDVVWATTDADGIYRSDNAWDFARQQAATGKYDYYLVSICALDENTAWAAGPAGGGMVPGNGAGIVEHTADGGKTWVNQLELDIALVSASFTRPSAYYFAEGTTREGFDPFLCVANPGGQAAEVSIAYMLGDGTKREQALSVPASSRATVCPEALLGRGDDVSRDFGAVVTCTNDQVIYVERPMYFSYRPETFVYDAANWTGGHCVTGATFPSRTWFFAEGCTGRGFEEWICVLNPGDAMAYLTLRFQTQEEGEKVVDGWGVSPRTRISLKVNEVLGSGYQCSLALEATQPVVAERSMYFASHMAQDTSQDTAQDAAQDTAKDTARDTAQDTAKDTSQDAARDMAQDTAKDTAQDTSQDTAQDTARAAQAVHPTGGVPEAPWTGGHCVMGATALSSRYFFAEGCTRPGFEEWLAIQNPGSRPISVEAVYEPAAGQGESVAKTYRIEARRRYTLNVSREAGPEKDLSVRLSSSDPFLAERPVYFCYGPGWDGGHCAIGATAPTSEQLFAEGFTGEGFHEWLTLYNPGDEEARVEITYLTQEEGALPARTAVVPARSRLNVFVNESAGEGYQLSTRLRVLSGSAIVSERPMYFRYGPEGWTGGHVGG